MTIKEYNQKKYRANPKRSFLNSVRSYAKILTALGVTCSFPDDATFDAKVDAYLLNRPTRSRIDWEEKL